MRSTTILFALVVGGCGDNEKVQPTTEAYHVGGTVSGLTAPGLVLQNNGGDDLTVMANTSTFQFITEIDSGATYDVSVRTQPTGELCTVTGGTGTATAEVQTVVVTCATQHVVVNQWTWKGGSDVATNFGLPGIYGTKGTAAPANIPGARHQSASWRDATGNLWLFGGFGMDKDGNSGQLDDLWKYDGTNWTWVSGTDVAPASTSFGAAGSSGVYGTLGVADAANVPGGREQVASWVDASGALWIFGGEGIDANGVTGELNDLWKFDGTNWTWMGGGSSVGGGIVFGGPSGVYGTKGTADAKNIPGGRYGASTWKDAQGNFWLFGGSGIDANVFMGKLEYLNDLWKFSPTTKTWTWVAGPDTVDQGGGAAGVYGTLGAAAAANYPGGRDAANTWTDAAGNIWIFGGIGIDSTGAFGFLNDLWKFDGTSWTWVNGSDTAGTNGGPSGVYGTQGTAATANVPGGRFSASSWIDAAGALWLLGGQGYDSAGTNGPLNDMWKFDGTKWTWMTGSDTVGMNGGQPGVYGTLGTMATTNTPGSRFGAPTWIDAAGKLWMFGGMGYDSTGSQGYLDDLWSYQP